MRNFAELIHLPQSDAAKRSAAAWKVAPAAPLGGRKEEPRSFFNRVLHRRQPTTFQRCLAVHIHFAGPRGGLS